MVFKKMLRSLGVGGPSVDTVLSTSTVQPGGMLTGEVRVTGGDHEVAIEYIALSLVTKVEVETDDAEFDATQQFHRGTVSGPFRLAAGQNTAVPFEMPIPWETPITDFYGQHLHGMSMGVKTELSVAKAVDKGDRDPIVVAPLPSQRRVLEAFGQLGFRFKNADNERGRVHGVNQTLPFFQEIEFYPPAQFAHRVKEIELTFVADPQGLAIVLEADNRGGFLVPSRDTYGRWYVTHEDAAQRDWTAELNHWLSSRR
jgi:sporulation-control protein